MSGKRKTNASGDDRNVCLLLFHTVVSGVLAIGLCLRDNGENDRAGGIRLHSAEDNERSLDDMIKAMPQQGKGAAGKMDIVRAATGIVKHDILTLEILKS